MDTHSSHTSSLLRQVKVYLIMTLFEVNIQKLPEQKKSKKARSPYNVVFLKKFSFEGAALPKRTALLLLIFRSKIGLFIF